MTLRKLAVGVISSLFLYAVASRSAQWQESHCGGLGFFLFMVSGVSVMKGEEEVHIHAPMVISDAGFFNTYEKLLPKELQAMPGRD